MAETRKKRPRDPIALAKLVGDSPQAKLRIALRTLGIRQPLRWGSSGAQKADERERTNSRLSNARKSLDKQGRSVGQNDAVCLSATPPRFPLIVQQ
jgi:hypothetical protein